MSKNFKVNLSIFLVSLVLIIIGMILIFNGINNDSMGTMFAGIGIVTLNFIIGMGVIAYRVLRSANQAHREEVKKFYSQK